MKVTAALATAPGEPLRLADLDLDRPRPGEVQVRMVAAGVCHTDAIVRDQWYPTPLPAVLGHEGAGVVQDVGEGVTSVAPGDHVLLSFASCGACSRCLRGQPAYCANFYAHNFSGRRLDGSTAFARDGEVVSSHFFGQSSFASVTNVAERSVVKVSQDAPLEVLAPLGCGIQTGAGAVLNVLRPGPSSSFVVFGAGAVGLSAVLAAVVAGASRIVAVDLHDSRLELARALGATDTVDASTDAVAQVREITGGGADHALDTTGNARVFRQMAESLAVRGHGVLVGASALGTETTLDVGTFLLTGASLSMCIEGDALPQVFLPQLVELHARGRFPLDRLVEHYPIDQIATAFDDSAAGRVVKPVVTFS